VSIFEAIDGMASRPDEHEYVVGLTDTGPVRRQALLHGVAVEIRIPERWLRSWWMAAPLVSKVKSAGRYSVAGVERDLAGLHGPHHMCGDDRLREGSR